MKHIPRDFQLEYLREYPLGQQPSTKRRNVPMRITSKILDHASRADHFRSNPFTWRLARRLEGREHVTDSEGVWPINFWRCERKYGDPGSDVFTQDAKLDDATSQIFSAARERRILCYHRVANAIEAKELLAIEGQEVRYATELTSEWYDPPNGNIVVLDSNSVTFGSHGVPLVGVEYSDGEHFVFPNSWGIEWGAKGFGRISAEHFDQFIIEAWNRVAPGLFVPVLSTSGIICLEWKWALNDAISIHGREIVDAQSLDSLAWAFCKRRGNYLDIEDFYVWPSKRGQGYGRALASMIKMLAQSMDVPLRLLVSYADTEPENNDNLYSAARLLGVELQESGEKWVHLVGLKTHLNAQPTRVRPQRPAFMLEWLRPKDEKPIDSSIEYSVFFGTNRRPNDSTVSFGIERDKVLHTGIAKVTIPRTHQFGSKGRWWAKLWNLSCKAYPRIIHTHRFSEEAAFAEALSTLMSQFDEAPQNLLYVHGFKVTFKEAVAQAAQFGVDLKIPGATFVYSWPSVGRIDGYLADEATIEASLPFFEEFLHQILRNTNNLPLNIIVHSMGNRAIVRLLESVAREQSSTFDGRIRNLIFAAPDVDTDVFKNSVQKFLHLPSRTTLYATRADMALQTSEWLHNFSRAGLAPPVITIPNMDTVLVEGFNLLDLGHSYYAAAAPIITDMFVLLKYGSEPKGRPKIVPAETLAGERFWKLLL